ncbi:MAG: hybrid sensor histidine kinase/response regulator [Limisphaerales bacterium]
MKKILLIDDEPTFRDTMGTLLRHHGFEVMDASDGLTGVKLARSTKPDLVISDIVMEPVDGFMTLSILRQQADTARIPFVLVTGQQGVEDARRGMVLGADDYITKPFQPGDLIDTVNNLLERRNQALAAAADQVSRLKTLLYSPLPDHLTDTLSSISGSAAQIAGSEMAEEEPGIKQLGSHVFSTALKLKRDIRHALVLAQLEVIATSPDATDVLRQAEACQVTDSIESVSQSVAKQHNREGDLQVQLDPGLAAVGSMTLSKILEEVITNAFQYSPADTPVVIQSVPSEKSVVIAIENRVVNREPRTFGGPNETITMQRDKESEIGSGLGLMLTRRLVEIHGGKFNLIRRNNLVAVHIQLPTPFMDVWQN